jgi:hypothetical protein
LPEGFEQLAGENPVSLESSWESVEGFVDTLRGILTEEMKSIRETSFDPAKPTTCRLLYGGKKSTKELPAYWDTLDRLLVSAELVDKYGLPIYITTNGTDLFKVIGHDDRYVDDKRQWVVFWLKKDE